MTAELATDYIARRMKELGYGNNYYLRFRHLVLRAKEKRKIEAPNQLFLLINPHDDIAVKSDFGIYDATVENINECQYEHQGSIQVRNYAAITAHARFIQAIPHNTNEK
jgi:hypothetical protein